MKFNYVKSLIVSLGLAVLITGFNSVFAGYSLTPAFRCMLNGESFPCDINSNFNSQYNYQLRFYNAGSDYSTYRNLNYYKTNSRANYTKDYVNNSDYISGNILTYNNGDFLAWWYKSKQSYGSWYQNGLSFNFINVNTSSGTPIYEWWYDKGKKYNSSVSRPGLPDLNGESDWYEYVVPWHSTWIFYNLLYSSDLKTIQYIGNQALVDKIIYVDSLAQTDNVWLIDTVLNKAWSMTVSDIQTLSDFMFGNVEFTNDFLNNAGRTTYYDVLLLTGGNYFLPQTYGNFVTNGYLSDSLLYKSSKSYNIGLVYNQNYDFKLPDYGNGSGNNNFNSGSYNNQVLSYEKCLNKYEPIGELSNLMYNCYTSYSGSADDGEEFFEMLGYVNTLPYYKENDLEYTGYKPLNIFSSCSRWLDYADMVYQHNTGSDYYYIAENAVAYGYTNSFNIENFCGSYPTISSEQSWACQYLGVGCDGFSFGMGYDNVKSIVKPFWDESIGLLVDSFNSGYNYISIPACTNDYYGKSYGRANTFFVVFVSLVIFYIYQLFKS